jgi:hypothetical protein
MGPGEVNCRTFCVEWTESTFVEGGFRPPSRETYFFEDFLEAFLAVFLEAAFLVVFFAAFFAAFFAIRFSSRAKSSCLI